VGSNPTPGDSIKDINLCKDLKKEKNLSSEEKEKISRIDEIKF
jgi:hypothetical protein